MASPVTPSIDDKLEHKLALLAHAVEEFVENGRADSSRYGLIRSFDSLRRAVEVPEISDWLDRKRREGRVPLRRLPVTP